MDGLRPASEVSAKGGDAGLMEAGYRPETAFPSPSAYKSPSGAIMSALPADPWHGRLARELHGPLRCPTSAKSIRGTLMVEVATSRCAAISFSRSSTGPG